MTTTAAPPALGYIVWHKPNVKRARWKKLSFHTNHAEAVRAVNGNGSFWIATIRDPVLLQGLKPATASLFD